MIRRISSPRRLRTLVSTDVIAYSSTPLVKDVSPKHLHRQPPAGPQIESGLLTLWALDGRHNSLFACPRDFIRISEMTTFVFQIKYTTTYTHRICMDEQHHFFRCLSNDIDDV